MHSLSLDYTGDLNTIFHLDHKDSSNAATAHDIEDALQGLFDVELNFLKCMGCKFSWCNKGEGAKMPYSRIDHALVNSHWMTSL